VDESDNSNMQEWLPLFPLQVVLLPGADLPLHIFEDRYKEMIQDVLRERNEFGVILANEKGIVNTGCTATIEKVLREYPDGRMDILTLGRRRFEIQRIDDEKSYLRGEVEFFDDEDGPSVTAESRNQAIEGYNQLQALNADPGLPPYEASDPQLSFRLARPIADLSLRQALLVARNEADRIRQLAAFLPAYVTRQKKIQHVKTVAPRNGHGGGISHIE
jgi:Lon protease-like protein